MSLLQLTGVRTNYGPIEALRGVRVVAIAAVAVAVAAAVVAVAGSRRATRTKLTYGRVTGPARHVAPTFTAHWIYVISPGAKSLNQTKRLRP